MKHNKNNYMFKEINVNKKAVSIKKIIFNWRFPSHCCMDVDAIQRAEAQYIYLSVDVYILYKFYSFHNIKKNCDTNYPY